MNKVLEAAVRVAVRHGLFDMSREAIAQEAGCSTGKVSAHLGTADDIRAAVLREAVSRELLGLVMQGLAIAHPVARSAPMEVRVRALQSALDDEATSPGV